MLTKYSLTKSADADGDDLAYRSSVFEEFVLDEWVIFFMFFHNNLLFLTDEASSYFS